ncbi:MAG: hypothetical protein DRR08_30085 [Candidatus Parabeggiatoa sp. nov. 2]|nr:MAG: hypothetical protein DRR08_30085 [Gammaproteobacteria bacterium]
MIKRKCDKYFHGVEPVLIKLKFRLLFLNLYSSNENYYVCQQLPAPVGNRLTYKMITFHKRFVEVEVYYHEE